MDNTLWDFDKNSREALFQLFSEHHLEKMCNADFKKFVVIYERINSELWHLYSLKKTTKEELRYQRFHKTFTHFKYDNINLAKQWAEDYLKIAPYKTHLVEGALDVLNYLKHKYTLHIITNGFKEVQHVKLDVCNLKPFFDQIIISEEYSFNKPDIQIFKLAESLSKSHHTECIMIGDNYEADILGALNAEWKAIYLSNKKEKMNHTDLLRIQKLIQMKESL